MRTLLLCMPLLLIACSRGDSGTREPIDFAKESAKLTGTPASAPATPATGAAANSAPAVQAPPASAFAGAATFLPRNQQVAGWVIKDGPQRFDGAHLYEAINGGADRYLGYGFEELALATYQAAGTGSGSGAGYTDDVAVEVYLMKSPAAAQQAFQAEGSACDPPDTAPGPGCSRKSDRVASRDRVFLKVIAFQDAPEARRELTRFAEAILARVQPQAADATPPGSAAPVAR